MRLFLIHSIDFPNGMAGSAHVALMIRGFRKNNIKANLIIPFGIMGEMAGNIKIRGHDNGVPFIYMNGTTKYSRITFLAFFQILIGVMNTALIIYKNRKKLDAVIIGTPDFLKYLPIIISLLLSNVPFFVWAAEKMTSSSELTGLKGNMRKLGYRLSEHVLPKFANGILVISRRLKDYYQKYLPAERILLTPILVDKEDEEGYDKERGDNLEISKKYKNKRIVLYSGTFSKKDGVSYLVDAFYEVQKKYDDVYFVLTGSSVKTSAMEKLKKQVEYYKIENKVEFTGMLSRRELMHYLKIASILLVCRINDDYANYGFPWKLGEYALIKKPILATDISDVGFYFTDKKDIFLAISENSEDIAKKMLEILQNEQYAKDVALNGYNTALKYFDYINEQKKVIDFIRKNLTRKYSFFKKILFYVKNPT